LSEAGACAVAVGHEVGLVPLGRPSVVIAVSAPHRGEAFTAARQIIDELKLLAPIWKLEIEGASRTRVDGTTPQPAGELTE
jgi:molybdopterin synthase catalytic subunit